MCLSTAAIRVYKHFLLLIALLASGAASGQAQTLSDLAVYDGPDRSVRLIAGAKLEGSLQFYTTIPPEYLKPITDAFEKNMGSRLMSGAPGPKRSCSG